jgi:hypothetical protein
MRYSAEGQVHSVSVEVGGRFGTVDVCQRELRPRGCRIQDGTGDRAQVHNTRYSAEGQVHSVSVEVGGRFGTVDVCQRELRDLKKAKGTKRKRLQVDFISGISESVAVGRIKENSTVKQTSVEAKRRHFQAIAATVADQQDGDSVGLEAVAIAVGAVGAVVAAASQVIPQQQPMILTGAVAEEPVHVAPAAAISRGQEWRRKKREELTDLVTGPFSLGGDLCVECVHCCAMLWPVECTKVFPVSIEDMYTSLFDDRAERERHNETIECEVEAVLARRVIPGDHCFYTGEAFEYKLKWKWWPVRSSTCEYRSAGCDILIEEPIGSHPRTTPYWT